MRRRCFQHLFETIVTFAETQTSSASHSHLFIPLSWTSTHSMGSEQDSAKPESPQRKIVFVLGGPGSGKGTQVESLEEP